MTRGKQRYNRKPGSFDRFTSAQINSEGEKLLNQEPLSQKNDKLIGWSEKKSKADQALLIAFCNES